MRHWLWAAPLVLLAGCAGSDSAAPIDTVAELQRLMVAAGAEAIERPVPAPRALIQLGQALFFDKVLSGDRNIGCSTCHNPAYHTADQLPLSIGTGGTRSGGVRQLSAGAFTSRGSPDLFNRGHESWRTLFWDGRVALGPGGVTALTGPALPAGLSGPLAAQALIPLLARVEMRGAVGANELAALPDTDAAGIWAGIVTRLRALPGYDSLFAAAFPAVPLDSISIVQVANAIAAFESEAWAATDSPYDRFLRGDTTALSAEARRGGVLFFGRAGCASCHRGVLLTDQAFHNIGIPPLGPGVAGGPDLGRALVTGRVTDRYAFRTPPLRNLTLTSPYMHNGVYQTLEQVIQHYADARGAAARVDPALLDPRLRTSLDQSPATLADLAATLDTGVVRPIGLSAAEVSDLVAFLFSLTDQHSAVLLRDIPRSVPSGLPVLDR